jgi:DNA-binding transcriptional regulator GbsR (MarR family)
MKSVGVKPPRTGNVPLQAHRVGRKSQRSDELSGPPTGAEVVADAQDRVSDVMGEIAEFWGFTRTMGRIFGLVYMSAEPLDQSTVRSRLNISAGSASTTMTALLDWGVLHREGRLYVAETNFFKLITAVLRQREAARVEHGISAAREVVADLRRADQNDPAVRFALQRAEHMLGFFEMGGSFLEAFVERSPIRAILNGLARTASRLRPAPLPGRSAHAGDDLDPLGDDDHELGVDQDPYDDRIDA